MKKIIFVLILLSSLVLFADKLTVTIYQFENETTHDKNRLPDSTLRTIEAKIRSELIKKGKFKVTSGEKLTPEIKRLIKESHELDRNSKYKIELGQKISARYLISGKVLNEGSDYTVFAEMTDLEESAASASGDANFTKDKNSMDKAAIKIVKQLLGEEIEEEVTGSEAQIACRMAKSSGSREDWAEFIDMFGAEPEVANCVSEGKKALEKIDYDNAVLANDLQTWEEYIKNYPSQNKLHVLDAKKRIKKLKESSSKSQNQNPVSYENNRNQESGYAPAQTQAQASSAITAERIGNLYWSEKGPKKMNLTEAQGYCRRLNESGISGWRLPTIDELRTIIRSCPGSQSGGACKVSENKGCLAPNCISSACKCGSNNMGKYSVFGDKEYLWSSSEKSSDRVYTVDFSHAEINHQYIGNSYYVRCVK